MRIKHVNKRNLEFEIIIYKICEGYKYFIVPPGEDIDKYLIFGVIPCKTLEKALERAKKSSDNLAVAKPKKNAP